MRTRNSTGQLVGLLRNFEREASPALTEGLAIDYHTQRLLPKENTVDTSR